MDRQVMDGIHGLLPEGKSVSAARKLRAAYRRVPGAPLFRREFWLMGNTVEKWQKEEGMPEYIDHPVKDWKTWEQNVKFRLNPETPERIGAIEDSIPESVKAAREGYIITQNLIGGYMFLRSLIGPGELLYMFYDFPDLIHDCMKTWFNLADSVIARHQKHVTTDEIFFAEDICYNHGPLISPDMMREFLTPYYQQLVSNLRKRQIDRGRHLYI